MAVCSKQQPRHPNREREASDGPMCPAEYAYTEAER